MFTLLARLILVALALLLLALYVPGVVVDSFYIALIVAVILGVLNLTVRPIILILMLPITILTFGLFSFVLNALLVWFVASFVEGFAVAGFIPALITAVGLSVASWVAEKLVKHD